MIIKVLRKNIGTILALFGFALLCIITFGDLGEFMTDAYWENVKNNLLSISFLSISLTLIQISIKQGLAEQALQSGLNTENTTKKYLEHKTLISKNVEKMIYLPYFLQMYNKRHTALKKREFLVDNNLSSEKALYNLKNKKLIRRYNNIRILITAGRIKWATTDICYNKNGQIQTLQEHRSKRISSAIFSSILFMAGATLLTKGLFDSNIEEPLWQKLVKLITYVLSILLSSLMPILKEYEKGAFGVPNDLDEINEIWLEFEKWKVPDWVVQEVIEIDNEKEVIYEERKADIDNRANIQEKQKEKQSIPHSCTNFLVPVSNIDNNIHSTDDKELNG